MKISLKKEDRAPDLAPLLLAILDRSGYDFRGYAKPSLRRRLEILKHRRNLKTVEDMVNLVERDKGFVGDVLRTLSITVSGFFRDPEYYRMFRETVLPELAHRSTIKIWHAGCATGEEAYSLAILLREAGIYERSRIYATDFNGEALRAAREGIFSLKSIRAATSNYAAAGGKHSFTDYYHAEFGHAKMSNELRSNLLFSHHNLVSDGAFGEMDIILCRNVMIYFGPELKSRVFALFRDALSSGGFLCLGSSGTLDFSDIRNDFESMVPGINIYRRLDT